MSRLKEIQSSQDDLNQFTGASAEYQTSWHLADISVTLAMLYDLFTCECIKEIHMDNNGISIVPCSEVRHETDYKDIE